MKEIIKSLVERIYINKDYEHFQNECKSKIDLDELIYLKINQYAEEIREEDLPDFPSQRWYFDLEGYNEGTFHVSYSILLTVSRIAPVFYIQHEFEIKNYDINRMCPVLDGFGLVPYTKKQADIGLYIEEYLEKRGYVKYDYSQLAEIVVNVDKGITSIVEGEKFSMEDLLFNGMLDIEK